MQAWSPWCFMASDDRGPKRGFLSLDFLRGRLCERRACSIAWIMHWPPKPGTAGSNPAAPAIFKLNFLDACQ